VLSGFFDRAVGLTVILWEAFPEGFWWLAF
jgi:hypothetical protein